MKILCLPFRIAEIADLQAYNSLLCDTSDQLFQIIFVFKKISNISRQGNDLDNFDDYAIISNN